jgi:hypothetical protein
MQKKMTKHFANEYQISQYQLKFQSVIKQNLFKTTGLLGTFDNDNENKLF